MQQAKAIDSNDIKLCIISKWEHSPNNDTLEIQNDSTFIYYRSNGLVDSLKTTGYKKFKKYNFYNAKDLLTKRLIIETGIKITSEGVVMDNTDTTYYEFEYQNDLLIKEMIESPDIGDITINYTWEDRKIKNIELLRTSENSKTKYSFDYIDGQLKWRKSSSDDFTSNKSNQFIYDHNQLIEITNTWMLANDSTLNISQFSTEEEKQHMSDILNTKYSYYESGLLKSFQKVYGMWPGESFWITEFRYQDDGLIKEKEMNNDNVEIGPTKIIYRYEYFK
jgi:hypothetical protein